MEFAIERRWFRIKIAATLLQSRHIVNCLFNGTEKRFDFKI